jgi:hypothetical protein
MRDPQLHNIKTELEEPLIEDMCKYYFESYGQILLTTNELHNEIIHCDAIMQRCWAAADAEASLDSKFEAFYYTICRSPELAAILARHGVTLADVQE